MNFMLSRRKHEETWRKHFTISLAAVLVSVIPENANSNSARVNNFFVLENHDIFVARATSHSLKYCSCYLNQQKTHISSCHHATFIWYHLRPQPAAKTDLFTTLAQQGSTGSSDRYKWKYVTVAIFSCICVARFSPSTELTLNHAV